MGTCKTAKTSRRLDEALEQGFPAGDPPALTEPAGDARDAQGCCCDPPSQAAKTPPPRQGACCGGRESAK